MDNFAHAFEIIPYIGVWKPQLFDPLHLQVSGSYLVVFSVALLVMLGSIELYAQPYFSAIEIDDVRTDEDLVGEPNGILTKETEPEYLFCFGHVSSHVSGTFS